MQTTEFRWPLWIISAIHPKLPFFVKGPILQSKDLLLHVKSHCISGESPELVLQRCWPGIYLYTAVQQGTAKNCPPPTNNGLKVLSLEMDSSSNLHPAIRILCLRCPAELEVCGLFSYGSREIWVRFGRSTGRRSLESLQSLPHRVTLTKPLHHPPFLRGFSWPLYEANPTYCLSQSICGNGWNSVINFKD